MLSDLNRRRACLRHTAGLAATLLIVLGTFAPARGSDTRERPRPDARFGNWLYKTPDPQTWKKTEKEGRLVFGVDLPAGEFCTLTLFPGAGACQV